MANTKTAKKQLKINERNRLRNRDARSRMRSAVKDFLASLEGATDKTGARAKLAFAQKLIHRSVSNGVLKKGTAVRKVSRLYRHFNRAFGREPEAGASA